MFGLRKIIGTLLMVVAFLVLASLASVFYGADQAKQAEMVNSPFVQNAKSAINLLIGTSVGASESMAEINLQKNAGLGKTMVDLARRVEFNGTELIFKSENGGERRFPLSFNFLK